MKAIALLVAVSLSVCASAQSIRKPSKDGYMRCLAAAQIMSSDFAKGEKKEEINTQFEGWVGFLAGFYPDAKTYIAEAARVTKSLQADLVEKRITPEAFVELSDQCSLLFFRTMREYMQCTEEKGFADETRALCTKKSVGL